MIALEDMVGCAVETGLEVPGPCAVALTADLIVGIANPLHLLIRIGIGVSVMRNLVQNLLPQRLIALPVCHDGIVKLPGRAELLVEDHVFDGSQGVGDRRKTGSGAAVGVVLAAAPRAVLPGLHAALHGDGEPDKRGVIRRQILCVVIDAYLSFDYVAGYGFDRSLDLLEGFHLIEIAGPDAALLAVKGIDAVVDGHAEDNAVVHAGVRRRNAVARRIVVSGTGDLLAADDSVVAGIPEFKAELAHHARDDDLVILEQGQTADALGRFESAIPEFVRSVLVDAQRNGRIVQAQVCRWFRGPCR